MALVPAFAQEPPLPPNLAELAGLAFGLPAEFAADALLQVAGRLGAAHRVKKREMLEDAFTLAGRSQLAMPMKPAVPAEPGSALALRGAAYSAGLDALSLQSRAVIQMRDLDPKLAAEYFQRLTSPSRDPLTCNDFFVWDSSPYWQAAERLQPSDLRPIVSPLEIGPASAAYIRLKRTGDFAFLRAVDSLSGDDRAFSYSVRSASRDLETYAAEVKRNGGDPAPVIAALASFLKRHLSAPRCADTAEQSQGVAEAYVSYYNTRLRLAGYLADVELPPIRPEEIAPGSAVPAVKPEDPEWLGEYRKLQGASAYEVGTSKLYNQDLLVWWLVAKPLVDAGQAENSSNLVMTVYSKLKR